MNPFEPNQRARCGSRRQAIPLHWIIRPTKKTLPEGREMNLVTRPATETRVFSTKSLPIHQRGEPKRREVGLLTEGLIKDLRADKQRETNKAPP